VKEDFSERGHCDWLIARTGKRKKSRDRQVDRDVEGLVGVWMRTHSPSHPRSLL
jgi:hypothetical protein